MMTDKKKRKLREGLFIWGMLAWPLIMWLIFYVGVNSRSIILAFQRVDANYKYHWNGLTNFKDAINMLADGGSLLGIALINNLKLFFWTFVIGFALNMVFSYYLFKQKLGHQLVRFTVMTPSLLSGINISTNTRIPIPPIQ